MTSDIGKRTAKREITGLSSVHGLNEIVERVLLAVVPQTRLELGGHLLPEAVVQELVHAPVHVVLHTRQAVPLIRINLEIKRLKLLCTHILEQMFNTCCLNKVPASESALTKAIECWK